MAIEHAILGLLSWKPMTGYEMKHIFENSSSMYWSGNNNQIYKALVQLLNEGLVTHVLRLQERLPSKKIYTVTPEGLAALKSWVTSHPEAADMKKSFLVQLAWADLLSDEELSELLNEYEREVEIQLLMEKEKLRRGSIAPNRTPREELLWDSIAGNLVSSYEHEIQWVRNLKGALFNEK